MPEEEEPPRPHGDKLKGVTDPERNNPDEQRPPTRSDAPPDLENGADPVSGLDS
jgi:hypothetical protein